MEPESIEARVTTLEEQIRELADRVRASVQDAAAARVLAGAADRDVTELRDFRQATTASFNATREDLNDLRTEINDLRTEMNERFNQVDNGFIEMRGRLDAAAAGQQLIVELIQALEGGHGAS